MFSHVVWAGRKGTSKCSTTRVPHLDPAALLLIHRMTITINVILVLISRARPRLPEAVPIRVLR